MHLHSILSQLVAAGSTSSTTAAPGKSTGSGSSYTYLILIAVAALAYVLFIRPRSQRMRQQQQGQRQLGIGDEVMSAGGIYGKVVALDADEVEVEVSPGVVLTFIRRAVSLRQAPGATPPARGGFFGPRPAARTAAAPAAPKDEPPDPWDAEPEPEPDGPGDTAAEPGDDETGDDGPSGEPGHPGSGTSEG